MKKMLPVQELARESLYAADEIFLTGTASEVTPVRSLDRIQIGALYILAQRQLEQLLLRCLTHNHGYTL